MGDKKILMMRTSLQANLTFATINKCDQMKCLCVRVFVCMYLGRLVGWLLVERKEGAALPKKPVF